MSSIKEKVAFFIESSFSFQKNKKMKKYQLVKFIIPQNSDLPISASVDTDRNFKKVAGIYATSNSEEFAFAADSTIELHGNGTEVFPKDFEVKMLASDTSVAPMDRFWKLDIESSIGNRLDFVIRPRKNPAGAYNIIFYLQLEN